MPASFTGWGRSSIDEDAEGALVVRPNKSNPRCQGSRRWLGFFAADGRSLGAFEGQRPRYDADLEVDRTSFLLSLLGKADRVDGQPDDSNGIEEFIDFYVQLGPHVSERWLRTSRASLDT